MKTIRLAKPLISESFVDTGNLIFQVGNRPRLVKILANACAFILKRIGCLVSEHEVIRSYSFETVQFNVDDVFDGIAEHVNYIAGQFNIHELTVLMGSKNFYQFTKQTIHQPFCFTYQAINGMPQICGMKVVVLPWMDGVVCVPKEYLPVQEVPTSTMIIKKEIQMKTDWQEDLDE